MKQVELLLPAGDLSKLKSAAYYGADAIYIGTNNFSLRSAAHNFSLDEINEAVTYLHSLNKKLFVALNIYPRDDEFEDIKEYVSKLNDIGVDGLIVADTGILYLCKQIGNKIPIHISTQANTINSYACNFYKENGVKRIVLARELRIDEIKQIRNTIPKELEIECFIHGSMCISYSGRCLLSNYFTSRDANHGECTHPCRWKYALKEESRPNDLLPIVEDDRGTYIMNSKDLCMIDHVDDLIEAGINSFKIEGRMKNELYVSTCASLYKNAINDYLTDKDLYYSKRDFYKTEIVKCVNRGFCTGFYYGNPTDNDQVYENSTYNKDFIYLGKINDIKEIDNKKYYGFIQKNKFTTEDSIEIIKPDLNNILLDDFKMYNDKFEEISSCAHPKEQIYLTFNNSDIQIGDIIRMQNNI